MRQGASRILVQVPGLRTPRAEGGARRDGAAELSRRSPALRPPTKTTRVPPGYKIYPADKQGSGRLRSHEPPVVPGEDLVEAQSSLSSRRPQRHRVPLQQVGCAQVRQVHVRQHRAAVRDRARRQGAFGACHTFAAILGGSGQIYGNFTAESANKLAIQLRSGALPAKLDRRRGTHGRSLAAARIPSRQADLPASSAASPWSC